MKYKYLELINKGLDVNKLPKELQDSISDIQTLSDNGETDDADAHELDEVIYPEIEKYLTEITVETIETEPIKIIDNKSLFVSGNFYKNNPEKVLGEYEETSGRFGKVMVLKGTIKDVERIDADLDFSFLNKEKQTGMSQTEIPAEKEIEKPETQDHVESIFKKGSDNVTKKTIFKSKAKKDIAVEEPTKAELQSFEEIFSQYNKDITEEELKVFIWYKEKIGQPLSQKWYDLADTSAAMMGEANINEWVTKGFLYYYNGELLPAFLYLAENIYDKMNRLVSVDEEGTKSGQDKEYIINTYGQSVYDNQLSELRKKHDEIYQRRIIIKGAGADDGLILIPNSNFAKTFFIKTFIDEQPFKWKMIKRADGYGKLDWQHTEFLHYRDKHTFEKLNLTEAFMLWLVKNSGEIEYKKNISYSEIIKVYILQGKRPAVRKGEDEAAAKAQWERTQAKAKSEGDRLFGIFLDTMLTANDKLRLEMLWNRKFNGYLPVNYNKVPVALEIAKTFRGEPFEIKSEKLDAIRFLFVNGSGCLAYDVGVGKTVASVFVIEQFIEAGYCHRPFIVCPNQTYRQWIMEIKNALPQRKINDLYNLRGEFAEQLQDENQQIMKVESGSISVMTYEGFEMLGFNQSTQAQVMTSLYDILNQGGAEEQASEKQKEGFFERLEKMMGKGLKGGIINVEDLGFDFACYDEAHAMKKVFTTVKGEAEEQDDENKKQKRGKTQYKIQSGVPSTTALKGFMISQYILRNNHYRNVLLLTATPFTNSPLEIFSMLALIAYKKLQDTDLNNISNFFDNYIGVSSELVINAKLQPQYRQVIKGFQNLPSLQSLIKRFFDYKSGEDIKTLIRPNKIVLPLTQKMVDGNIYKLSEDERIDTFIPLSPSQQIMMDKIKLYAEGKIKEAGLGFVDVGLLTEEEEDEDAAIDRNAVTLDEDSLTDDEKAGVRVLKSMSFARNLALSPYLYEYSGLSKNPTATEYIESSPKLKYICDCVASVKKYHESKNEPVSGQVIYMDRGIEYFKLIKQYLIETVGYKEHEIGIMYSGMKGGRDAKERIKNAFLGIFYNEKSKMNELLTDDQRMKIIIGSSTIKEGMNLQVKSTVLYDAFLDWNPTDFVQLTGRIHRQGNEFANVRICCPLMIDSIDIFMFQKLEEKTQRINTLWSADGRTVLKLEEVDPAQIKSALIKDPMILAKMQIEEQSTKLSDDIASENNNIKRLETIEAYKHTIETSKDDLKEFVLLYRPTKAEKNMEGLIAELQDIIRTQTDDKGYKFVSHWERTKLSYAEIQKQKINTEHDTVFKPHWFDDLNIAHRNLKRERKDFLISRKINEDNLQAEKIKIETNIKALEAEVKKIGSEESLKNRAEEIRIDREKNKITVKPVYQLVKEFEKLNYLLSIKRSDAEVKAAKEEMFCEVRNASGERMIDEESIEKIEKCLEKLPSTKSLHTDANGEYTEERKKLHEKIIKEFTSGKVCITTEHPIAILTGGSPGSGKTTFLKKYSPYLLSKEIYTINADDVREKLPEYKGWNSSSTHQETRDIVHQLLSEQFIGKPCNYDLIYDGTMNSTKNYLPLIGQLKRLGYRIYIIYINKIPYSEIVKRTRERYKKSGRYVPIEVINDFFAKGKAALNELKTKVDGYVVVDGSTFDYTIIEKGGIDLPKDREYSKLTTPDGLAMKKSKKEVIEQKLKGFETLLKVTKDKTKKEAIQQKIKGFNVLLKTIKK